MDSTMSSLKIICPKCSEVRCAAPKEGDFIDELRKAIEWGISEDWIYTGHHEIRVENFNIDDEFWVCLSKEDALKIAAKATDV
jgi:hypothetical protein